MALKRRDVAISAFALFIAWGFATHWIPTLRWLGYAFVAGAIAALGAICSLVVLSSRGTAARRELRHGARRPQTAAFLAPEVWKKETAWLSSGAEYNAKPLYPSSFLVSNGIGDLFELLLNEFVTSWYTNISRTPRFKNEADRAIRLAIASIRERASCIDLVEVAVARFIPLITSHLGEFYVAEHAVRGKRLNRTVTESEELDLAIATKFRDGKLHPAASLAYSDTKIIQQDYLRKLVVRLMPDVLPESMLSSRAVSVLINEIVSCAVLAPAMQMLSDPDTWNQLMEAYGQTMLQDRKSVRKLRAALDEHASPAPKISKIQLFPKLSPNDDERKFERFIRAIRQCQNLSDARRFRSEVASQLKRESMVESQDHMYLRRLETGKRILDQRIGKLSTVGSASRPPASHLDFGNYNGAARATNTSIVDILHDASGLSYFMEYMDRHGLMTLVQFWVVVDGFRNPLEDDFGDDDDFSHGPVQWTESDRSDIAQITEAYLSKPELNVPESSREVVRLFLKAGRNATPMHYRQARSAVLRAQTKVLENLRDKHFPAFKNSDLYYKHLSSEETNQRHPWKQGPRPLKPPTVASIAESPSKPFPPLRSSSTLSAPPLELRRNASSSHDLKSTYKAAADLSAPRPRRSLDVNTPAPLFNDDVEPESMTGSHHSADGDSIFGDSVTSANGDESKMVAAMEAALTHIVTDGSSDQEPRESLFDFEDRLSPRDTSAEPFHPRDFTELKRDDPLVSEKKGERPNLASLGLVNTSSRIGVFTDNDLFGDEEKFLEDEHADPEDFSDKEIEDEIHQAAPGDLGLAEAITALTIDIDKLISQDSIVDTLTRKAELTNNVAELRILGKSKSSLQREIRRKELQRQQYIVQESDNSLFGRASVHIKSIMVGKESDGQEFALYVIEVQRKAIEQMPAASWAVARRYSEFHDLHQRLRYLYPAVRSLQFPRRRLVMKLQRDFLHKRRLSLETYLRELLRLPDVCGSRDLRAFLSQSAILSAADAERNGNGSERRDIVSRIYNSVTDGMDEFLGNVPVLDQLSVAGQNLISAATSQYSALPAATTSTTGDNAHVVLPSVNTPEAQAELEAFESKDLEPFVKPICDLFLEVFELNRSQNWLRGRAVVVVLHQLLGGTVERKVREMARSLFADAALLRYLALVRDTMWPGGVFRREAKVRTEVEKARSRREVNVMLATLIPDLAGNVVGRANAQGAARRVGAVVNNGRLSAHLAYVVLDEVVQVLFPEKGGRRR